jgi:hypothetical protein
VCWNAQDAVSHPNKLIEWVLSNGGLQGIWRCEKGLIDPLINRATKAEVDGGLTVGQSNFK